MMHSATFRERVFRYVRSIPQGEVRTYGEVARAVGSPRSARAVGAALKTNYDPAVPCHRVIRADGDLGGYNRGAVLKRKKLKEEGAL